MTNCETKAIIEFDAEGRMMSVDIPALRVLADKYEEGNRDDMNFMAAACITMLDNFLMTYSAKGMVI